MFGIQSLKISIIRLADGLAKFNETIHGSAEAAAKTTEYLKAGSNGIMTVKSVKDCVVTYQCKDMICFTVSVVGTTADISSQIYGSIPSLKKVTPITVYISIGCKSFVHFCQTGNITFSCKEPV